MPTLGHVHMLTFFVDPMQPGICPCLPVINSGVSNTHGALVRPVLTAFNELLLAVSGTQMSGCWNPGEHMVCHHQRFIGFVGTSFAASAAPLHFGVRAEDVRYLTQERRLLSFALRSSDGVLVDLTPVVVVGPRCPTPARFDVVVRTVVAFWFTTDVDVVGVLVSETLCHV